jgi:uncharacterized DUF497 family protein
MLHFEWAPEKAASNLTNHGVSFAEASTVFDDLLSTTTFDPDHSVEEDRFIIVGESQAGRMLLVAHTERGDTIRIISARTLTRAERKAYAEQRDFGV